MITYGGEKNMTLKDAVEEKEYIIQNIETDDEEMDAFLFSLGCYSGEKITVMSHLKGGCIVSIKDGRYNIDNQLAQAIVVWQIVVIWIKVIKAIAYFLKSRISDC